MHDEKVYGYICYESDFHGDDRSFLVRCRDGVALVDVIRTIDSACDCDVYSVFDVLSGLGDQLSCSDYAYAIIDCQRGNVRFWINVFQSGSGITVSLGKCELDGRPSGLTSELQAFEDSFCDYGDQGFCFT